MYDYLSTALDICQSDCLGKQRSNDFDKFYGHSNLFNRLALTARTRPKSNVVILYLDVSCMIGSSGCEIDGLAKEDSKELSKVPS